MWLPPAQWPSGNCVPDKFRECCTGNTPQSVKKAVNRQNTGFDDWRFVLHRKYFDASLRASAHTGVAIRSSKKLATQGVLTIDGFIDLCQFVKKDFLTNWGVLQTEHSFFVAGA